MYSVPSLPLATMVMVFVLVCAFFIGMTTARKFFLGSKSDRPILPDKVLQDCVPLKAQTTYFFVLKTGCPVCIKLLKLTEKLSAVLSDKINFIILLDGMGLDESRKLGDAYVLPDKCEEAELLMKKTKISPSLFVYTDNECQKYTGLYGCGFGMIKTAISVF